MKVYKIPVSWQMYGTIEIEANSLDEAIEFAETGDTIGLPDGEYVDGSWEVDSDYVEIYNPKEGNKDYAPRTSRGRLRYIKEV